MGEGGGNGAVWCISAAGLFSCLFLPSYLFLPLAFGPRTAPLHPAKP